MTMKKQLVARGFAGALSLCGVLGLVGCGAETGEQGAAGEGEIGSTSQALTGDATAGLQFYGSIKLEGVANFDATPVLDSLELQVGGLDNAGNAQTQIAIYDAKNDTLNTLKASGNSGNALALTSALAEPIIAKIPNQAANAPKYLIGTGRSSADGTPQTDTYILSLSLDANSKITSATLSGKIGTGGHGTALPQAVVLSHKSVKQCGQDSAQKLIAFGGITAVHGWQDPRSIAASKEAYVLTFVSTTNGQDSTWAKLNDGAAGTPNVFNMRDARGYNEVLEADLTGHTKFFVPGGMNNSTKGLVKNDFVQVDTNCTKVTNATVTGGFAVAEAATDMPAGRARFSSIKISGSTKTNFPSNGVDTSFEYLVGGGNPAALSDGTAAPVGTFLFDVDGTTTVGMVTTKGIWLDLTGTSDPTKARIFSRMVHDTTSDSSTVHLVTGWVPHLNSELSDPYYNTTTVNDVFTVSATTGGSWSVGTAFSSSNPADDRVGTSADLLNIGTTASPNVQPFVGPGGRHAATTGDGNPRVAASSMLSTYIQVP